MRRIIVGGYPEPRNGLKITDPSMAFTSIDNCYIIYEELGAKNVESFLTNYYKKVTIFARRMPPKRITQLVNHVERVKAKPPSFFTVYRAVQKAQTAEEKAEIFKSSRMAPRYLLKQIAVRTVSPRQLLRLLEVDQAGEPTYDALANALVR